MPIREPFGPVTAMHHVPFALFEIQVLAKQKGASDILNLVNGIIAMTLSDARAWQQIAQLQPTETAA
jgi:hypothetical protein